MDLETKSFILEEGQLPDLAALAPSMMFDANDPRSPAYRRILIRPTLHWGRILLYTLTPLVVIVGLVAVLILWGMPIGIVWSVPAAALLVYLCVFSKKAAICLVKMYQHYAPDAVRNRCVYEPSCSQYMILSIEKYGVCRGILKGIGRIRRCGPGFGGIDKP